MKTLHRMEGDDLLEMRSADVEPVLENVKALRGIGATGNSNMRHAARVEGVVIERYCNDRGITFHEFMNNPAHQKAFLNSPDHAGFRVWQGKV